jgi:hypothetical protein
MSNYSVSRHPFGKKNNCQECPIRRERLLKIAKLEGDVLLLKSFNIPSPKATSQLETARWFQAFCNSGECHQ